MYVQLLSRTCESHKLYALKVVIHVAWSVNTRVFLTRELAERRVRLQVETLPVLIEGLHAELARLFYGPHGHLGHHRIDVKATSNLSDKGESNKQNRGNGKTTGIFDHI